MGFESYKKGSDKGFTIIELILVIVIVAILAAIAAKKLAPLADTFRLEDTRRELDNIALAITGNPELRNGGIRTDFGYVGDVGALPPDLDGLISNPGSYSTWNGPYIKHAFEQAADNFKIDAWQTDYVYAGGITITSSGSGENIIRRLAGSSDELLRNRISGNIYDADGTPPGNVYKDSIAIRLTVPDGVGGTTVKTAAVGGGGYFSFDSIPVGNHALELIYKPDNDTLTRFVAVTPGSNPYARHNLASNVWKSIGTSSGIVKVAGSDSLVADCHGFYFWIENNTGAAISIDSVTLTWSPSSAFFRYIKWDGVTVFDRVNPKAGSGETISFTSTQTILDGQTLRIDFDFFKGSPTGGADADMDNLTFTVDFDDGSSMTVNTGTCP